jgi:hypothetical protein
MEKVIGYSLVGAMAILPAIGMADGVNVTAATGALSDVATAVAAIGALMVTAAAAGIAYRWVTAFLVK